MIHHVPFFENKARIIQLFDDGNLKCSGNK